MEKKNIGRYLGDLSLMHGYPGNLVTLHDVIKRYFHVGLVYFY